MRFYTLNEHRCHASPVLFFSLVNCRCCLLLLLWRGWRENKKSFPLPILCACCRCCWTWRTLCKRSLFCIAFTRSKKWHAVAYWWARLPMTHTYMLATVAFLTQLLPSSATRLHKIETVRSFGLGGEAGSYFFSRLRIGCCTKIKITSADPRTKAVCAALCFFYPQ